MNDDEEEDQGEDVAASEQGEAISYSASLVTQGKHRFYTLTMPSDVLAKTCTVDMRAEDPIKGFQRRLDPRRAKDIANLLSTRWHRDDEREHERPVHNGMVPGLRAVSRDPDWSPVDSQRIIPLDTCKSKRISSYFPQ